MPSVVFNQAVFKITYPEFSGASDSALNVCFAQACLYLNNNNCSPVQDLTRRAQLLDLLTAHVAQLRGLRNVSPGALPVGRVSNASEGSVSAGLEYGIPGKQAWFIQTQYGAMFWQATISLRSFRYRARPTRF